MSVLFLAITIAMISRRPKFSFICVVGVAIASVLTSPTFHWDGGYPLAQLQLTFVDTQGVPVQKVELLLDSSRTSLSKPLLLKVYPLEQAGFPLIADSNGSITCFTGGQSFGGTSWYLFWVIPMGRHPSDFCIPVSFIHPDYNEKKFSLSGLLRNDIKKYADFPKTQINVGPGQKQEVPIYSKRIILENKKDVG